MADKTNLSTNSTRNARKCKDITAFFVKRELRAKRKEITNILHKINAERTKEDDQFLIKHDVLVKSIQRNSKARQRMLSRKVEKVDCENDLEEKCAQLALAIRDSKHLVVYTGAGISTAASIPDYRGPDGVWTKIKKGEALQSCDPSFAVPTSTHMAIAELNRRSIIKHIVSQNCDGLHLRSGIPRENLSELHGNMFIEYCISCGKEYIRLFDVTERTQLRKHNTGRKCECDNALRDSIVHFGEKGGLSSPYRWPDAKLSAERADLILILGSSLKVLRQYSCLWQTNKNVNLRPNLYIVNLQWTPKDDNARLKINANCDEVMKLVMQHLGFTIPEYIPHLDPLFKLVKPLREFELSTTTRISLTPPKTTLLMNGKISDHNYAAFGINFRKDYNSYIDDIKDDQQNIKDENEYNLPIECTAIDKNCLKQISTKPGWFGKGLRKQTSTNGIFGKRKRKKLISVSA